MHDPEDLAPFLRSDHVPMIPESPDPKSPEPESPQMPVTP